VRWLSRGHVLQHVFELCDELFVFVNEHYRALAQFHTDVMLPDWLTLQTYKFNILNSLNLSLKGRDTLALMAHDKINAF
jgi:hypothetical protein